MPHRTCLSILLLGLGIAAAPAVGQAVRGELVDAETGAGISGAIVTLADTGERIVASTLTDDRGGFLLRPADAGTYQLRAERIGYGVTVSPPFRVTADETAVQRLVASTERIRLEGVVVQTTARCTVDPASGAETAVVWEEARKALRAADVAQAARLYRYRIHRYDRLEDPRTGRIAEETSRSSQRLVEKPFESVPLGELSSSGFIVAEGDTMVYYAPSAEALLSDEFLDSHCFRLEAGNDPELIGLAFQPVPGRRVPDIAGVLWVDRDSAELRTLEFGYTNAPIRGERGVPAGIVEFRRLPNGVTYIHRWAIRMPNLARYSEPSGLPGAARPPETWIREVGGEIASVTTASGARVSAEAATVLTGVVYDSTRAAPLAGARVYLSGTSLAATTDSAGRYTLSGVRPGTYTLGVQSPRLTELGYTLPPVAVSLARGTPERRDLSIPSWSRILTVSCEEAPAAARVGAIAGFARDTRTGSPAAGVPITVSWRGDDGQDRTLQTRSDSLGAYRFCGVPVGADLIVSAAGTRGEIRAEAEVPTQHDLALSLETPASGSVAVSETTGRRRTGGRDVITREQIMQVGVGDALSVIRRLHPEWLRVRGGGTLQTESVQMFGETIEVMVQTVIAAYLDLMRLPDGVQGLAGIPADQIESIQFLNTMDATTRFGTEHPHGAILVMTRRG